MKPLRVDVWSDIACPWCYVGKRRLESAIKQLGQLGSPVDVHWRAFELDPQAPKVADGSISQAERLAKKYGMSVAEADRKMASMTAMAAKEGLDLRFDRVRGGNTFDAHRLLHYADGRGVQDLLKERFMRAYFTEGEVIGDPAVLLRLATEVGLDGAEVKGVLESDAFAKEVRNDQREAQQNGVSGVPFFVVADRYGISGAQPAEALLKVLEHARAEQKPVQILPEGAACGPEGCA